MTKEILRHNAINYIRYVTQKYTGSYKFSDYKLVSDTTYRFIITTPNDEEAGDIQISLNNKEVNRGTRSSKPTSHNVFHINWVGINAEHQHKGLGIALVLYAICTLYLKHTHYTHITLDDAIMGNQLHPQHIYIKLGFMPQEGLVELTNNGSRMQPVKSIGEVRSTTIEHLIGAIVPNYIKSKKGGTRKTRRYHKKQKKTHSYRR
jgi:hypothetical protein